METEKESLLELRDCSDEESADRLSYSGRRSRPMNKERALCIIVMGSFILAFSIAAVSGYVYQRDKISWWPMLHTSDTFYNKKLSTESTSSDICLTPTCVVAAAEILSNIDDSVDPCNDFYQFACGGWLTRHSIPKNRASLSFFQSNQDKLNIQLKELLEKKLNGSEPSFVSMLKNFYETCMDDESIEKVNSQPLKEVFKVLGGWPVIEGSSWNEFEFDWIETQKSLRHLGYSPKMLLDVTVGVDHKNISTHIIELDQAVLGMPDRTYLLHGLNDTSTAAYFNLMLKVAKKLGADENTAKEELMKSLNFEIALANFSLPREAFRNASKVYNKYTVRKLQQLAPQVPWLKFLNSILNAKMSENETLDVINPNFVMKFGELISATEKRVIANYMLWRVALQSLSILSTEWRDLLHEYNTVLTGTNQKNPRWVECLSSVAKYFNHALSSYYVRNYFSKEKKEIGMKLYEYIQKEFLENFKKVDWMGKEAKEEAIAKVKAIKPYSGYPNELLKDNLIQGLYSNLKTTNDSFFDNILNLKKWATDSLFSLAKRPYLKRHWTQHSDAILVNAFYNNVENSIEFLAGILQKGFIDKNRPDYMNFGALGFVLAHELTHSLDDLGSQFDKNGNNVKWWDKTTEKNFRRKAQCIIDQFSNFTAENGMKLNGFNTQGENIADNGGFKLAYKAYQSWIRDNGAEQKLPGLKYTPSQLFWISATNIWCVKYRPEALKLRIITGSHTPDNFRIIGGLSNLAEFSKEFNCPPNTQMNPKNKCAIW